MNLTLRRAEDRGRADFGWLDSRHTFSFGHYHDPLHMGFAALRVINDDRVAPAGGFPEHPHTDMEIVTYVLDGALEHRDTLGNGSVIRPGDVQRMSAGTGIRHSEYNASRIEPVHFLQIWVIPERRGLAPGYEQRSFADAVRHGHLTLIGSRDGREGSVTIHQDVNLYAARLAADDAVSFPLDAGRAAWIQVARGSVDLADLQLSAGDGVALDGPGVISLAGRNDSEVLLFDLARPP